MQPEPATDIEAVAPANLGDENDRRQLTPIAIKAIDRIAAFWSLTTPDICGLLGGISERTWYRMKGGRSDTLGQDAMTRISAVIGIFKGLRLLFSEPLADNWVSIPNRHPIFGGRSPVRAMVEDGIPKMLEVRTYIDALRGGL